ATANISYLCPDEKATFLYAYPSSDLYPDHLYDPSSYSCHYDDHCEDHYENHYDDHAVNLNHLGDQ
ncbi:hypothetical protein LPJ60_006324, partial [Coemansia sp. RSA 2675]